MGRPGVPELKTTLSDFESVVGHMRKLGVAQWVGSPVGDITLGPPPKEAEAAPTKTPDPLADRRTHYEGLLNQKLTDAVLAQLP